MPRTRAASFSPAPPKKRAKRTQLERLLAGIVSTVNANGYGAANVSSVIAAAGVSRPTFYEHFSDRDECFLAAVEDAHQCLAHEVLAALQERAGATASAAAVSALISFASSHHEQAQFLMSGTLAGGPRTLDARDQSVLAIAAMLAASSRERGGEHGVSTLRGEILIGAVYRMLASRLRRGERALDALGEELQTWMAHYERSATEPATPSPSNQKMSPASRLLVGKLSPPEALPPGRPSIGEEAVAENHRLRIVFATAELVRKQGYTATTIADITREAGVDGRVFYRVFADKQQAFSAIHELGFQQLMAATAGAFFAVADWPARMWEAMGTLTGWLEINPAIAHVGFVESYAVGPAAVQRVEDSLIAFTIFLQEGYQHTAKANPPSRVALEAIVTCVFEVLYLRVRAPGEPQIASVFSELVRLSLTPFLGAEATASFIDRQMSSVRSQQRTSRLASRWAPGLAQSTSG